MPKIIDLTNKRFGRLIVLYKDSNKKTKTGCYWVCKCDCGNIKSIRSDHLRKGHILSCGCYNKELLSELRTENLKGQKFGMLRVIKQSGERDLDNRVKWTCLCDCGTYTSVRAKDLKSGHTQSCGCYHQSFGELAIKKILQEYNINFIEQYRFIDFKNRIYDFAIFDKQNNLIQLIEFDGEQHFREVSGWSGTLIERQKRDEEKNEYAYNHNIPLIRISYLEKDKINIEKLLKSEVRKIYGL